MTAIADLLSDRVRERLEDRQRELALAELDRLMRQPGGLAGSPEPRPIHAMGAARNEAAEPPQ